MAGNAPHIPGCRDLSLIGERVARSLFSATSDRVGRPVTVTVFPPLSEGRTREGFDRAAATAQRLGAHPSVVTIHEWGHAPDGRPWVVTDPQPAESVDTQLTMEGPLEVERALQVGVLLAGALETAHRAGIVHGDLSPARLVFGAHGEPLLAETGLAPFAVLPGLGALNNPVRYYAPPEVLERTDITPATDVYSLATTVYALLAGRAPQQKPAEITDSNASLLLRILQMPVPPIDRPDLPRGLFEALRGPLSPSPSKRPQQAIEVAWLLQDAQRRAGLAITEPVVLDLDDIGAAPTGGRSRTAARGASWTPAAPAEAARAAAAQAATATSAGAGAAPALIPRALMPPAPAPPAISPPRFPPPDASPPALGPPAPTPPAAAPGGPPGALPASSPSGPTAPGPSPSDPAWLPFVPVPTATPSPTGDDAMPPDPWAAAAEIFSLSEPEPPPPTIFPFAPDGDALSTTSALAAEPPSAADDATPAARAGASDDGSPRSSSGSGSPSESASTGTLWPSTWPSVSNPAPSGADRPWPIDPPPPPRHADSAWPTESAAQASPDSPWSADSTASPTPPDSPWTTDSTASPTPSDSPWATDSTTSPTPPDSPWSADTAGSHESPDSPWATDFTASSTPPDSPWSSDAAAPVGEAPAGALWPSTWPADTDRPPYETPSWAAQPQPDGGASDTPPADPASGAAGGDGGSISDAAPLASGAGSGGDAAPPPPSFTLGPLPPELDELPSWYTDPLPSAGGAAPGGDGAGGYGGSPASPGGNGHAPHHGDVRGNGSFGIGANGSGSAGLGGAADGDRAGGDPGNGDAGDGSGPHGYGLAPATWPPGGDPGGQRLPGAGDELRSLFGEVVGEGDEAPPIGPGRSAPQPPSSPASPTDDPLGPPNSRPPIDLRQLDTPLGPAPFLPPSSDRPAPPAAEAAAPTTKPTRLARRHEVESWPPGGQPAAKLPRAGEARADRSDGGARSPGDRAAAGAGRPATSGPPALPLIVLIAVVAVLVAGVAWLVLTGDESPPPASEQPSSGAGAATGADATSGDASADASAAPTDVRISQGPEGMQVAWTGPAGDYVVTILSIDQPPKALPPTPGPSVLVPNADLGQGGAWCFTVAAAAPETSPAGSGGTPAATPGPASEPACTPGTSIDAMRGA
jgi:serine/threonine protein kinase